MSGALALLLVGSGRLVAALLTVFLGLLPRPEGRPVPEPSPPQIARPGPAVPAEAWSPVDTLSLNPRAPPASWPAASSFSPPSVLLLLDARGSLVAILARGCAAESLSRAGESAAGNRRGRHAGANWYAYCDNDPINRADPTGLDWYRIEGDSDGKRYWYDRTDAKFVLGGKTYLNVGRMLHVDYSMTNLDVGSRRIRNAPSQEQVDRAYAENVLPRGVVYAGLEIAPAEGGGYLLGYSHHRDQGRLAEWNKWAMDAAAYECYKGSDPMDESGVAYKGFLYWHRYIAGTSATSAAGAGGSEHLTRLERPIVVGVAGAGALLRATAGYSDVSKRGWRPGRAHRGIVSNNWGGVCDFSCCEGQPVRAES